MFWQKVGYASFMTLMIGALVTGRPDSMLWHSGGCTCTCTCTCSCGGTCGGGGISGANGVYIDAEGLLHRLTATDATGQVMSERMHAARTKLDRKVAKYSKLRKVSLNRLEAAVKARLDKNLPLTEEMQYLAGLLRVRYVFYYPETKDIVVAGPAEGWAADLAGHVFGVETGRATVELQDLVAALRAFPPSGKKTSAILCSIDPTPEGLARLNAFSKSIGPLSPDADIYAIADGVRSSLGLQNIRVSGVPARSHFAQVLIEADYRMKLIGLGMEEPAVKLASYVDKANPSTANHNALQRWFFIPDYNCARVTADRLGMELVGNGVKLVGEDQVVQRDGKRLVSGKVNKASKAFVDGFTRKYSELALRTPVYAQLRNVIDLAITAAFIQQQDYYGKAGWGMDVFSDEQAVPIETLNTPQHVETVADAIVKNGSLMTPVGGGVTIHPTEALKPQNVQADEEGSVGDLRESLDLKHLAADQWWWD